MIPHGADSILPEATSPFMRHIEHIDKVIDERMLGSGRHGSRINAAYVLELWFLAQASRVASGVLRLWNSIRI